MAKAVLFFMCRFTLRLIPENESEPTLTVALTRLRLLATLRAMELNKTYPTAMAPIQVRTPFNTFILG